MCVCVIENTYESVPSVGEHAAKAEEVISVVIGRNVQTVEVQLEDTEVSNSSSIHLQNRHIP